MNDLRIIIDKLIIRAVMKPDSYHSWSLLALMNLLYRLDLGDIVKRQSK